jgi:hypothetical protein
MVMAVDRLLPTEEGWRIGASSPRSRSPARTARRCGVRQPRPTMEAVSET